MTPGRRWRYHVSVIHERNGEEHLHLVDAPEWTYLAVRVGYWCAARTRDRIGLRLVSWAYDKRAARQRQHRIATGAQAVADFRAWRRGDDHGDD